jgi:hypothetical protein
VGPLVPGAVDAADLESITALGDEGLEKNAGSGGHEIRTG